MAIYELIEHAVPTTPIRGLAIANVARTFGTCRSSIFSDGLGKTESRLCWILDGFHDKWDLVKTGGQIRKYEVYADARSTASPYSGIRMGIAWQAIAFCRISALGEKPCLVGSL